MVGRKLADRSGEPRRLPVPHGLGNGGLIQKLEKDAVWVAPREAFGKRAPCRFELLEGPVRIGGMQRLEAAPGVHVDDHRVVEGKQEVDGEIDLTQPFRDRLPVGKGRHQGLAVDRQPDVAETQVPQSGEQAEIWAAWLVPVDPAGQIEAPGEPSKPRLGDAAGPDRGADRGRLGVAASLARPEMK